MWWGAPAGLLSTLGHVLLREDGEFHSYQCLEAGFALYKELHTTRPAAAMGRPDLGTLRVGAPADIALFRLEEGSYTFHDVFMQPRRGKVQLVNTATYVGGTLLPHAPERPPTPWVATDMPAQQRPYLHGRQ